MAASNKDIPCIHLVSSVDGFILDANPMLCELVEYPLDNLIGLKTENIFTLATRIFFQTHFYPLLQLKGHAEEIYITLRSKSGEDIPVLINAVRKEENERVELHFGGIKINQRKKYEDEIIAGKRFAEKALAENTYLKKAQQELETRAEELDRRITIANIHYKELSQINHMATHSLQEPVRKLLFFTSQLMESEEKNVKEIAAQKIRKAGEDMVAKLNGLQQFVWRSNQELNIELLQLSELIESAKQKTERENPEITIALRSDTVPLIEADEEQFSFLFKELLTNTVRFRKPGNQVDVTIHANTLLLNQFRHVPEKYKYAEFLKLEIKDNGIGFDDKYQDQAFELFRKLHIESGRGVGLALCKKIVENHGGSIVMQSKPGLGTSLILLLPIQQHKDNQIKDNN